MQDLELEPAELLPGRETLNVCYRYHASSFNVTRWAADGNTASGNYVSVTVINGSANILGSLTATRSSG